MSHDDFVLGYQMGRLGCGVSALRTLHLFLTGRIKEKRVLFCLARWSLALLVIIGPSVLGFFYLPALWMLLGTGILLIIFAVGFTHAVAGMVVSTAISDEEFYQFVLTERALWISADAEGNLPKLQRVVPLRDPRRAQR